MITVTGKSSSSSVHWRARKAGQFWNGSGWEAFNVSNYSTYQLTATSASVNTYTGSVPDDSDLAELVQNTGAGVAGTELVMWIVDASELKTLKYLDASVSGVAVGVVIAPVSAVADSVSRVATNVGQTRNFRHAQNSRGSYSITLTDANGDPYDCSGKTLRWVIHEPDGTVVFQVQSGSISVGGTGNNVVTPTIVESLPTTAGKFLHKLWDVTSHRVLLEGAFEVSPAPPGS